MALKAEIKTLKVEDAKEAPLIVYKAGKPDSTIVVSVETLVGPKGGVGEICHIVLDHGGQFHFVEGQYLGVIFPRDGDSDSLHYNQFCLALNAFSIASCRDGDSFDGKTLSLCVRRAELSAESASNYLCNLKKGDKVDIKGPFGGPMVFPDDPEAKHKHIMVATATGIAPFRSNIQRLFVDPKSIAKFNGLAWLIAGADNYNSLLYSQEFADILDKNPDHFSYERALNNSVADSIYKSGDEIFTLLNGGAYIYFAGSKTMMPGILETFEKIAQERGVIWEEMLKRLIANDQWRVEVY
ncbi:ferredoxin--NADP reductase, embryo isozyme, chloroplastic-like [Dioscorea cayenensis subsp. rotundata]|uniref:ferredoxin--NADP(+) reductase n=1 Tax=Dioscorea cayennensis subsp. rotundata TaxID=55577 RepID=A0AB40C7Z1_DIOCR|nr:ferredoxin--NADP reductase, embryo isozyme, chloroplastic-like [Dioscorea cayenensis subsp. rotundata]